MKKTPVHSANNGPKNDDEGGGIAARLLKSRTVLLSSEVSPDSARRVIEQLLIMEADDAGAPISLLLNSPGGEVHSGFAVFDVIRFLRAPVRVVCAGLTASIATVILLAVPKERRIALPHARLLIHQPLFHGAVYGPASDLEITANEILKTKDLINRLVADETGRTVEQVARDTERDFWLSATEALDYGLVGRVVTTRDELD